MSFKWFQNNSTVTISFLVAPTVKKPDLEVAISLSSIKAGLKGSTPLCDGQLWSSIRSSKWALKNNAVVIHLEKISSGSKWPTLFHYPTPDTRPRVCVTYEYDAQDDTELTLRVGDVVIVTNTDSSGWWQGELAGKSGLFPSNFAEEMEYTPPVLSVEPPEDFAESEKAVALEEQGVPLVVDRKTMAPPPNSLAPPVSVLPPAPVIATPPIPQEPEEETPQERLPMSNVTVVGSAVGVRMMPNIDELKNKLKNVGSNNPTGPPSAVGRGIAAQGAPRGSKIMAPNQNPNNPLSTSAGNSPFGRGGGSVRASVVPKQGLSNSQGDAPVSTPLNPTLKSSIAPRASVIGFKNAPNAMQSKTSGSKFNVAQSNNSQQSIPVQAPNVSPVIPQNIPEPIATPSPQLITRPHAKVVFDYEAEEESELALKEGDIVYILLKDESGWWQGEHAENGKLGWFPPNFVEEITEVQTTTLPPPPISAVLPPPVNDSENDDEEEEAEGEEGDEEDDDVSSALNSSGNAIAPKLVNPKQALLPLGPSGRKKPTKGSFVKDRNSLTSPMTQTPTPAPISPTTVETPTPKATPVPTPIQTPSVKQPALKKAVPPPISSPSPAVRKTVMPNAALPSTPSQPQQQPSPITTTTPPIFNEEKEKEKETFTTPPQQNIGGNQPNFPSNIIPKQIPLRPKVVPASSSVTSPTSQNRVPQINKTVPPPPSSNNQTNQNSTSNSSATTSPQTQPLPVQTSNNVPSIPMPRWPNHLGSFSDFCSEITNIISEVIKNNSIPSHAQHYHHTFTPILPPVPSNSQVHQEGLILSPFANNNTDSEALFASVCTVDGALFQSYEKDVYLPLLNCSAPFIYGLALKMHGKPHVHSYIGESTTNDPEAMITSNPPNPLTRAGMIVATSLILSGNTHANNSHPMTSWERINWVLNEFGGMSGARINANISAYQLLKERSTRDKTMINWLHLNGILSESVDVEKLLDFYLQLNSVEVSVKQASIMAATLACDGVCPVTTEKCIDSRLSLQISNVLTSSGAFVRSNGSGLVMVVVPKVLGMAFYSPVIDSRTGLPLRAVELARNITQKYKL